MEELDRILREHAKRNLAPILFAVPWCLFSNIVSAFVRNDGNPELATKAVIIGGMGIFGAGLATAIGQYMPM